MAYVSIPRDLTKVKNKIAFGLTKRQLIFIAVGALIAVPLFLYLKDNVSITAGSYALVGIIMPAVILGSAEKNGMYLEKYIGNIILQKMIMPSIRIYQCENLYSRIERKEDERLKNEQKSKAKKASAKPTKKVKKSKK